MITLISALDWGLGHTTRTIPLINDLLKNGDEVILAGSARQSELYKEFFPDLEFVTMPSFSPKYSRYGSIVFSLLLQLPIFLFTILREHLQLAKLIKTYRIEQVISDNRYGLYNNSIRSVFVGHQLNIHLPRSISLFKPIINRVQTFAINKFDECWIPDINSNGSIAGQLTTLPAGLRCNVRYVGILSRFALVEEDEGIKAPTILFLISGPEKQRTKFENYVIDALNCYRGNLDYLIIRGLPGESKSTILNSKNHCTARELKTLLMHSEYIICRAGYTSIMDLVRLKRTACLVPTPGQTEQEYLARQLEKEGKFTSCRQDNIAIDSIIRNLKKLQHKN